MSAPLQLDHIEIDDVDRDLIARLSLRTKTVFLAALDKGLSGSSVWRARWEVGGVDTKDHVFKIGALYKIQRELDAYVQVASAIDAGSPQMAIARDVVNKRGILVQELMSSGPGSGSLRARIAATTVPDEATKLIDDLYRKRLQGWHFPTKKRFATANLPMREALDWWTDRIDLPKTMDEIGTSGLATSLERFVAITPDEVISLVEDILDREERITLGPVHGDLHSQNILVGTGRIDLIDFGWTNESKWRAVDFLMLECSLKFLVTPANARLVDLLRMETALEPALVGDAVDTASLQALIHGRELAVVAAAVGAIRRAALDAGAVTDASQYRRGLVALTAGLASLPDKINRVFLLHSLATHVKKAA
ncbi:hypothetical protein OJ997_23445 [Solirubrobacter phytolaccae]|uniref:Ternary complex associated domain-containing protein n=1 Tax=Solirubrobacter phytolaccae TaxID=1404360 RepID=A0A9X3NC42_9ACTN|nr:hypothetical protein [Solirubrobacter phytolaccae]MDA0183286.1 hypothetical protein [Solirubrobacter phytolaccae]